MAKRTFIFRKERGVVAHDRDIHSTLDMWLSTLSNGQFVMSVERVQRPRSNPQNRLMWVWFTIIAQEWSDATGIRFTRENVHDAYCQLFLPVTLPNGNNIPGSTSKLSAEEMTDFLNNVRANAASEYGITLPDPDDALYYQFAKDFGYAA